MCMDKNVGGSGMGDKPCKTASFWVFGAPKRLLLPSRVACRACWCRNRVIPLTEPSVLLYAFQQTVGLSLVPFCFEHNFRQRGWLGQISISSPTSLTLLLNSRSVASVDHPRKTKQWFRQGWQNRGIRMHNVMDDTECRDVSLLHGNRETAIYIPSVIHTIHSLLQAQAEVQLR